MKLLIKNAQVYYQDCLQRISVGIADDRRLVIDPQETVADEVLDAQGLVLIPGLIDVHTHLRQPGFEYKETIASGTLAAAIGGYTTIFCMPNLRPVTDHKEACQALLNLIDDTALIRVIPYAALTIAEKGQILTDIAELAQLTRYFSDDGKGVQQTDIMRQAMRLAKSHQAMIAAHCEDERLLQPQAAVHDGPLVRKFGQVGISSASEYTQVARDLALVKETGCRYHVCHVSAAESVELIRQAKQAGLPVSCEVTPHHLLLCEDDVLTDDGMYKMNPPLRRKQDQQALLTGLLDQTIDMIATDHAPHSPAEKARGLKDSAFGIIGLQTAFGLLYQRLVVTNQISLAQLITWTSTNPAKIFQLDGGLIKPGGRADLALFDLNERTVIRTEQLVSLSKNTPFIGQPLQGINKLTVVDGRIVYRKGV